MTLTKVTPDLTDGIWHEKNAPEDANGFIRTAGDHAAEMTTSYQTRAAMIADATYLNTRPDGTVVFAAGYGYRRQSGATDIPGFEGWVPHETIAPQHFGAVGDGVTNDTTAINAFLSASNAAGVPADWGKGFVYNCPGNLPLFLSMAHIGESVVKRDSDEFSVSATRTGDLNTVYISTSGTGDGLTASLPTNMTAAFNFVKAQAGRQPNTQFKLKYAPGNYGNPGYQFAGWPSTNVPTLFEGEVEANPIDPDRPVPTVIFDGTSGPSRAMQITERVPFLFANFDNLKFVNFSSGPVYLMSGANRVVCTNLHGDNNGGAFLFRGGSVNFRKGIIENSVEGVVFQSIYGYVGDTSANNGTHGTHFKNISDFAIAITRRSSSYIRNCRFEGVGTGVVVNRLSRIRTQANHFVSWSSHAISTEPSARVDSDSSLPDVFEGGDFRKPTIINRGSPYILRFNHSPSDWTTHTMYSGPRVSWEGPTERFPLGSAHSIRPFQMAQWWMRSPSAGGKIRLWMVMSAGLEARIDISGASGSLLDRLVSYTCVNPGSSGNNRAFMEIEFTGPREGDTDLRGLYLIDFRVSDAGRFSESLTGSTMADLDRPNISGPSNEIQNYRLNVELLNSGTLSLDRVETFYRL